MSSPTVYRLLQSHGADFTQGLHGYSNIFPPQLCTSTQLQRVEYEYTDEKETCQDDKAVRVYLMSSNLMAYAFEPVMRRRVERPVFAEVEGAAAAPDGDDSEERVGNPLQCKCGHCSAMRTTVESVCCHEANLDNVLRELSCIILSRTFQMFCSDRDVLE